MFDYDLGQPSTRPARSATSRRDVPLSLVTDPAFDWGVTPSPAARLRGDDHLRDSRQGLHHASSPTCPTPLRGSYAGLGHEAAIKHLTDLGVTAVELLPVHQYVPDDFLLKRGLTNYWGYNTIGYFAPHHAYSAAVRSGDQAGGQIFSEFKAMVKALHAAGLEVILDVVFNDTAEGGEGRSVAVFPWPGQHGVLPARTPATRTSTTTRPGPATCSTPETRSRCG